MKVKILFFGQLKDIIGKAEEQAEVEDGADLGSLFERYARAFPRLAVLRASVVLARNREFASHSARLADGDEVAFLPPVSGGCSGDFTPPPAEYIDGDVKSPRH